MKAFRIAKWIVSAAAGYGASKIVDNIVTATTPEVLTKFDKVVIKIGAWTVGAIVAGAADEYVSDIFESVEGIFTGAKKVVTQTIIEHAEQVDPIKDDGGPIDPGIEDIAPKGNPDQN